MGLDAENLELTDFLDLPTLQEIQDSFAAVAGVKATITDSAGNLLTQAAPAPEFLRRQQALIDQEPLIQDQGQFIAPIMVNDQRVGTIRMSLNGADSSETPSIDEQKLAQLSAKVGLSSAQIAEIANDLADARHARPAAIQFLFLMANAIARLCYQEFQLRQRIDELTAVYHVAMMLSNARDLQRVLDRTVRVVCEVMQTKAASLRLLVEASDELVIKAVYNLSAEYLNKGAIRMSTAEIDKIALSPQGFEYVRNMAHDPRVAFPQESQREGIVSMLSVGMRYKGKAIGVLRVYTEQEQAFSPLKIDLLKAVAAQAAAAIENARLLSETREAEDLEKQVRTAAEVQQRMIPHTPPKLPGVDLASVYVPCHELGGDFYDFIPLPANNLGLVMADVSGKGVPASLIMASVRAFLRAQVDNVYYLYEVIRRINLMLCRDTKMGEFVTLFYGVLDGTSRRLTYCNAGHPPALLLRKGQIIELSSDNMVLGVNPNEDYKQSFIDLQKEDLLLLYTDGVTDAVNFAGERFGRQRIADTLRKGGASADAVAQSILWEVRKFAGLVKRPDDITMMVAKAM
ncbi:MAG TPA: SpoIIE family protein phosphatase [Tepidisphaeraceae bacterium]|nr:SpoIIE family protein phosphatase [Tepidisphaeraceae bacterium]